MDMRIASMALGVSLLLPGFVSTGTAQGDPGPGVGHGVRPRTAPVTVPAVIATIPVGRAPIGVAVSQDDTVYVANSDDSSISVINPGSMGGFLSEDDTIAVGSKPISVAVSGDDTVYVTASQSNAVSVINPGSLTQDDTIAVGVNPVGVAISEDDTVYVTDGASNTVSVIAPGASSRSYAVPVGAYPTGIAVTGDDTVYVANSNSGSVSVIGPGSQVEDDSIYTGGLLRGIAVSVTNAVYVASYFNAAVEVIRDGVLDDSIASGSNPVGVAVTETGALFTANTTANTVSMLAGNPFTQVAAVNVGVRPNAIAVNEGNGLIYVTNENPGLAGTVSVIDLHASAWLVDDTGDPVNEGEAGDPVTLQIDICDDCQLMDDSTVELISFDGAPVAGWSRDSAMNSWSGPVPAGAGTVDITVLFNGGQVASAGTFTYPTAPTPEPTVPPSAPSGLVGSGGDASAALSWTAPGSAGSFPVSHYEVLSSRDGRSCVTSATSCTVTGLTNGSAYTFTVRALNGAGWGPWSMASAVITPMAEVTPVLVISGSRTHGSIPRIQVTGTARHLSAGAVLRPWIRFTGQSTFTRGGARIVVDERGHFEWERNAAKKVHLYLQTEDASTRSNRITIAAA